MRLISICIILCSGLVFISNAQVNPNPCLNASTFHLVVLGSSTAAGTGPSSPDSTWVNRYRKFIQAINPGNQVTNLAIGGTTTYHIMPDWYIPPSGKPTRNSNNNVSRAIALNADAIVVNMPSNDASNGFSTIEQMHNFITIAQVADSAGIPVWVCTTQPRNGFNAAKKLIQTEVRDSILSYFGPYAIDFWNPFADASSNLKPAFNSGDGVHMNDTAHSLMEKKVLAEGILDSIYTPLNYTDHLIVNEHWSNQSKCGDSNSTLTVIVANIGLSASNAISVVSPVYNQLDSSTNIKSEVLSAPLSGCTSDTITFFVNTYNKVKLEHQTYLITNDSIKSNDTGSTMFIQSIGHPEIQSRLDTFCFGDSVRFEVIKNSAKDHVLWYNSIQNDSILYIGNPLYFDSTIAANSFFAKSVRGSLTNNESLNASTTSTTNWNGFMFDIAASDSINLDSLSVKINSVGTQSIVAYYRNGSFIGHENQMSSWTSWSTFIINVTSAGEFITLDIPDLTMQSLDTIGIYLHMNSAASTLAYRSSSPTAYSDNKLSILPGAGIAYTFGQIYTPRIFCGELFYHYGFNANGYCSTEKIDVSPFVSDPTFSLGRDTVISKNAALLLSSQLTFSQYLWSNGSVSSTILVDTVSFDSDTNTIWLLGTDMHGCQHADTIVVVFDQFSSLQKFALSEIRVFPNPVQHQLNLRFSEDIGLVQVSVWTITGQLVLNKSIFVRNQLSLPIEQKPGLYLLELSSGGHVMHRSTFTKQ